MRCTWFNIRLNILIWVHIWVHECTGFSCDGETVRYTNTCLNMLPGVHWAIAIELSIVCIDHQGVHTIRAPIDYARAASIKDITSIHCQITLSFY